MLGDIALCIPPGNDRYEFKDGRLALFWRGDEPVLDRSDDMPIDPESMTVVMTPFGSDRDGEGLVRTVSEPILKAAEAAGTATQFETELAIKDKVDRVQFERLASGVLRGRHQAPDDDTFIFLQATQSGERPDLMICSDSRGKSVPNDTCMAFAPIAGKLVTILVIGQNADRAFRVTREMVATLRSFAVSTAP